MPFFSVREATFPDTEVLYSRCRPGGIRPAPQTPDRKEIMMSRPDPIPVYFALVYSPDDGGFYCELVSREGKTLHVTEVSKEEKQAINDARSWASENGATRPLVHMGETWR